MVLSRRQYLALLSGVILLLAIAGCGNTPAQLGSPTVVPTQPFSSSSNGAEPTRSAATSSPAEDLAGIPSGMLPDGRYFLGNPNAPVTLIDHSDFL
jgi:hypothetical protein